MQKSQTTSSSSAESLSTLSSRSRRKAMTRQRILEVARKRFTQSGFQDVTTRDIAEAAEVAIGTVFSHFPDKHLLLRAVLSDDIERVVQRARETVPTESSWQEAALIYAKHLFLFHFKQRRMSVALLKEVLFDPTYLDEQFCAMRAALADRMGTVPGDQDPERQKALLQSVMANYLHVLVTGLSDESGRPAQWVERFRMRLALLPE